MSVKGNKGEYYLPYYIEEVILRSKKYADKIPTDMKNKLKEIVFNKYKNMLSDYCKQDGKIVCKDYFEDDLGKTQLTVRDGDYYFEIVYKNNSIVRNWIIFMKTT